jgi:hypothetical protein
MVKDAAVSFRVYEVELGYYLPDMLGLSDEYS